MPTGIVIGGADCVWDDVATARSLVNPDAWFVTNDMIPLWPERLDYVCTLHPEKLLEWLTARAKRKFPQPGEIWTHKALGPRGVYRHTITERTTNDWAGSSGLFACKVAIEDLGFDKVIVCGVPLVADQKHVVRGKAWNVASQFRGGWNRHKKILQLRVRSCSGWTKEFLGSPDVAWLTSQPPAYA